MTPQDKSKLQEILSKRRNNLSSIINFEQMFLEFSRIRLRKVVDEINDHLNVQIPDTLKIMYDDPFEQSSSRYFVQVKLFINLNQNNDYYYSNKSVEPTLRFVGNQSQGTVEVAQRLLGENVFKIKSNPNVRDLIPESISGLIVDFVGQVYK